MEDESRTDTGEPACWLQLVCADCGAVVTARDGHRPDCAATTAAIEHPEAMLKTLFADDA